MKASDYLSKLMPIEQDHLKDTQMNLDNAMYFKHNGDMEMYQYFIDEAKERLAKYESVKEKTNSIKETMPKASPETMECMCWNILENWANEWYLKIKNRLEKL